jgi:hypothetical protein
MEYVRLSRLTSRMDPKGWVSLERLTHVPTPPVNG